MASALAPVPAPGPPSIPFVAGPPFLGIVLNSYLYGILTIQYYNYFVNFRNDHPFLRNIVHVQFVLETAQTAMATADGFHWFVYGWGNLEMLGEFYLANIDSPILCGVIALMSQFAYCWRIYRLSGWTIVAIIIALTALCGGAGGIVVGVVNHRLGTIQKWSRLSTQLMEVWVIGSAVCDVLIATVMSYLVLSSNATRRRGRSTVATRVVRLVVETNVATAIVAIAVLLAGVIAPIAPPKGGLFFCPGYVLGKLYSNSFISLLNSRQYAGGLVENLGPHVDEVAMERQGINIREPRPHIISSPVMDSEATVHFDTRADAAFDSKHSVKFGLPMDSWGPHGAGLGYKSNRSLPTQI